uniref:NADH dehydrogenase subunit 6 n=1 Tax=Krisna nigromarginata TaxID=1962557 RepID=UPI002551EFC6|nr:NADH dehydrogenase subunit 6 [Krisna nigromarginata]WGG89443.1 NADH dehydrogenase subunit 6 [Krisna nigromarginata]
MKILTLKLMIINTMMTSIMKNPTMMMIILLIQTTLMVINMNLMLESSWFPMITFLMMIGGIMIIFMYMVSISANEKIKINMNMLILTLIIMIPMESMMIETMINENQDTMMNFNIKEKFCLIKLYNKKSLSMCMLMVLYLLLTMISVSKIVKHYEGPLRSMNYE